MIKSILGGKSKNLFDISKFIDTNSVKRIGNTLVCSSYGTSIGTLESLCPTLKASDTITISFKCTSQGVASGYMNINNRIFRSGSVFIASELGLSNPIYLYNTDFEHRHIPNKTTYSDIQLELGSTATEYVPHELTSYKSIMKVSDICQLVDKNKIPTTRTISGVTFTNNGDGSVTVNGTSTHQYYSEIVIPIDGSLFIPGHVYLNGTIKGDFAGFVALYGPVAKDYLMAPQNIYTFPSGKDFNKFRYIIRVRAGMTANNYKCTPQFFDLTEMFGAGNEPKTVAEFKAKFPNEYYPYSPSCFVTSYDERMPCKTKNLFSSSTEVGIPSSTKSNQSEKRLLEDGKWYIGFSKNNYYRGPQSDWPGNFQYNIWENSISIYTTLDGYGLAKCIYVEPNTKYTISCKVNGPDINIGCGFYQEDGTYINYRTGKEITTPQNCKFITIVFALGTDRNKVTHYVSDIQLVKGTTATDYVPYGYV